MRGNFSRKPPVFNDKKHIKTHGFRLRFYQLNQSIETEMFHPLNKVGWKNHGPGDIRFIWLNQCLDATLTGPGETWMRPADPCWAFEFRRHPTLYPNCQGSWYAPFTSAMALIRDPMHHGITRFCDCRKPVPGKPPVVARCWKLSSWKNHCRHPMIFQCSIDLAPKHPNLGPGPGSSPDSISQPSTTTAPA